MSESVRNQDVLIDAVKLTADIYRRHFPNCKNAEVPVNFGREVADQIIPLIRADTLKSISKEAKKLDGTTYLVPDYSKFREALKELGIEE